MGDYHGLYFTTGVLLLADIFDEFRSMCLEYYPLDPFHYFSGSGLTWDAMVKMTGVKSNLISDSVMYQFIEDIMRKE